MQFIFKCYDKYFDSSTNPLLRVFVDVSVSLHVCVPCRELSFKKGDILDLLHSVDDHWLEARLPGGSKGNIPRSYVKVRSSTVRHSSSVKTFITSV